MCLIKSGEYLLSGGLSRRLLGVNADKLSFPAFVFELNKSFDQRKQRVVLAAADVFAGLPFRTALTRENVAAENMLAAEFLQAKPLRMRIAAVP